MKKSLVAASAVVAGVAVAYPASSWLLGRQVEAALEEAYKPLADYPDFKVVQREYARGVFGATERVTIELFGNTARAIEKMQKDAAAAGGTPGPVAPLSKPVTFSVRSTIKHGPFPGFTERGAAVIDSALVIEGDALTGLSKAMGGQSPLSSHSVIDFAGGGVSLLSSPAVATALPGSDGRAGGIEWGGMAMKIGFTRGMKRYTIDGEAPRLSIAAPAGGEAVLAGLRLQADQQRIFDDEPMLYAGTMKFTLAEMKAGSGKPDGETFMLKQAAYDIRVPVQGEFLDIVARVGAEVVQVGPQNYGPAHYDFSLKHLHARTVAKFYRIWMKISSDPSFLGAGGKGGALPILAPLAEPGFELLKHNPELRVDRLSFRSRHGEASFSARARLKDAKPEEFSNPLLLMMRLEAGAEASLPEALLGDLMGGKAAADADADEAAARAELLKMQLAAYEAQGLVRREGSTIRSTLEFAGGQLKVNGQPFNPLALGAGQPSAMPRR